MDINKPLIDIDLPQLCIDFLYHEFEEQDGGIMLKTSNDIGKYINSMLTVSATSPAVPMTEYHIIIYLPVNAWNHHIFSGNYITIIPWKRKMLEQFIMAEFKLRTRAYFLTGYEKGYSQDNIIKGFLKSYSIKNNTVNYDSIKKMDYRNRERITEEVNNDIQSQLTLNFWMK